MTKEDLISQYSDDHKYELVHHCGYYCFIRTNILKNSDEYRTWSLNKLLSLSILAFRYEDETIVIVRNATGQFVGQDIYD